MSFPIDGNTRRQARILLNENHRASEFGENLTPHMMPETTCTIAFMEKYPEAARDFDSWDITTCK